LICQDINQLKSRETGYGHDESITSNCHVKNAYPPNRVETANHLSKLTGQTTIVKEQIKGTVHICSKIYANKGCRKTIKTLFPYISDLRQGFPYIFRSHFEKIWRLHIQRRKIDVFRQVMPP
jgi:hypothetical protein